MKISKSNFRRAGAGLGIFGDSEYCSANLVKNLPVQINKFKNSTIMKGIIATAAALVVATGMAMASKNTNEATKSSQIKIKQEASGIYNLRFDADKPGQLTVKINNEKGTTLMKEKIAFDASFERPYNFQGLPDGTYKVIIEKEGQVTEEVIQHVQNLPLSNTAYDVDVNQLAGSKYELVVKKAGEEKVKVKISNKNGVIFYDGTFTESGSFSQVFDLSKVDTRDVNIEISMANKTIQKSL